MNKDQELRNKSVDYRALMDSPGMPFDDLAKGVIYSPMIMAKMGKVLGETEPLIRAYEFMKARYPRLTRMPNSIEFRPISDLGHYYQAKNKVVINPTAGRDLNQTGEYIDTLAHELNHARQAKKVPEELMSNAAKSKLKYDYNKFYPELSNMDEDQKEALEHLNQIMSRVIYGSQNTEIEATKAGATAQKSYEDMLQYIKSKEQNKPKSLLDTVKSWVGGR